MSIRVKLTAVMVVVALLPLGLATWQMASTHIEDLGEDARKYNVATADLAVTRVDDVVEQGISDALKVGQVFAQAQDKSVREQAANGQLLGARDVHAIALYLPPAPEASQTPAPKVWGARAESRSAPPTPASLDPAVLAEATAEGRAFLPIESVGQQRFLPVVFPVYIEQPTRRIYAFAWAPIDLTRLNAEAAEVSGRHHEGRPEQVFLVDSARKLLAFHDPTKVGTDRAKYGILTDIPEEGLTQNHSFTGEYTNDDGHDVTAVVVTLPQYRWAVVVEQRSDVVYQSISAALKSAALIGVIGLLLALVLGFLLAGKTAAPVIAMSKAAGRVAAGDFDVRVPVGGKDEVGQLAGAFNAMAGDLKDYQAKLIAETRLRDNLSRYLSNEVIDQVMADPDALKLGGERRQITVMFADVVSFTRLTEHHDPEFLVSILNELFTIATEIVFKHGGIIDKFMGDSLMAVFGAPNSFDDDAVRAVSAAEELLRWMEAGNSKWQRQLGTALQMGIGIGTGSALAGNIGSERRMDYTVIGDTVNIAARLEALSKPGQLLMSGATAKAVGEDFDIISLGTVDLPGRDEPVEVFGLDE